MNATYILLFNYAVVTMPCTACPTGACPLPPPPTNGYLVNTPSSVTVKSSVVFACDEGFQLTQGGYLTCREDGFWDGKKPACAQSSAAASERKGRSLERFCGIPITDLGS